jgi:hypothetical protein
MCKEGFLLEERRRWGDNITNFKEQVVGIGESCNSAVNLLVHKNEHQIFKDCYMKLVGLLRVISCEDGMCLELAQYYVELLALVFVVLYL